MPFNLMKILFGISRNSTCYVDISTFFRVSSNLIHFHCSQRALRARKLASIDYLNGLAFILPFTFHLTVGNPEGEGGKYFSFAFPSACLCSCLWSFVPPACMLLHLTRYLLLAFSKNLSPACQGLFVPLRPSGVWTVTTLFYKSWQVKFQPVFYLNLPHTFALFL